MGCSSVRDEMTFFPDKEYEISKEDIPEHIYEKGIKTSDNETIQAFYFAHSDGLVRPLIIYFHGNGGNLYGRFGYANRLYEMNQNVLLVSYRGYAKSSGKPNEEGIYLDGEAALNYAKDSLGYAEEDIVIFGRSLGTTVAINTAQNRNFKGVVLVTPLTSGKEMAEAMGMESLSSIAGDSYNSIGKINNLKSPILIIHGTVDETIPFEMGKQLFDTYTEKKEMIIIEGGGHNNLQDVAPEQFWGGVKGFVK